MTNTVAILHDLLKSRAWRGTDELLHAVWGNKKCKKRLEARLPFDIQCLKHAQTFPLLGSSMCRSRQVKPREIVCATEMFDLIESLIMRATVLFRQLWRMIAPVRARVQRIGKGGRAGDEGSQWPTWSMSGLTEPGKWVAFAWEQWVRNTRFLVFAYCFYILQSWEVVDISNYCVQSFYNGKGTKVKRL